RVFSSSPLGLPTYQGRRALRTRRSSDLLGAFRIGRDAGGEGVDVNGNLGFRNLLGARRGLRGQFSVQSENRFSGRGGGGGEPPQGVAGEVRCQRLSRSHNSL